MLHVASPVLTGIETSDGRISRQMAAALARLQEASVLGRRDVAPVTLERTAHNVPR
jgi:hypothetical protein